MNPNVTDLYCVFTNAIAYIKTRNELECFDQDSDIPNIYNKFRGQFLFTYQDIPTEVETTFANKGYTCRKLV